MIGPYRLIESIGSGGMGEVWLAEQIDPVHRRVAVKLIKAGMDTREVVARFKSERQALALMDHPGIAKVFDAGSTPQGRPYFVMEYITGTPITQYCEEHKLSVRERLELFVQVCDAVQHAHQKAIIHRDLKPSNILVGEVDGRPIPRVIDFGVAKALSDGVLADQATQVGEMLGTLAYMSPEQASSIGLDVDTRTDVYSLGVILYELLAGSRPLDFHSLPFDQRLRRLREEEPPRPSVKIRLASDRTDATNFAQQLQGDLDAIALKALEKERSRRYPSPADLAADISRYLQDEAVLAVPPSWSYRAGKFVRRHRGPLAAGAACFLMLIAATGISLRQSIRATEERNRADKEAATSQAVTEFLQNDLLGQASSWNQLQRSTKADPDLKIRTALDRAAARVAGRFERQPEVEAAIRDTIGRAYFEIGMYYEGRGQLLRALDLRRKALGPENPLTLKTASSVGNITGFDGHMAEAEVLLSNVLETQRRVLGSEHPDTLTTGYFLANVYREQAKYPQAEALFAKLSEAGRRVLGQESAQTLGYMDRLADVLYRQGKYAEAEKLDVQVLEIRRRVLGPDHPDTTISMSELAIVRAMRGEYASAENLGKEILEIRRRVLGAEHPFTLAAMNNLAIAYGWQGKYAQAESLDRQTLEIRRRVLSPQSQETLMSMENLACDYAHQGKYSLAERLFAQTLEVERRTFGIDSKGTLSTLSDAVFMYERESKYDLAETYAAEVLAARKRTLGMESLVTMEAAADLAIAKLGQRKFAEVEPLAYQVLAFYQRKQPDDWHRFRAESLLGASLAGQKKNAEAESHLLEGYQGMLSRKDRLAAVEHYYLDSAHRWLVQFYRSSGQPAKALEWAKK